MNIEELLRGICCLIINGVIDVSWYKVGWFSEVWLNSERHSVWRHKAAMVQYARRIVIVKMTSTAKFERLGHRLLSKSLYTVKR